MGERPDRHEHWQAGVTEMATRRASYTPERLAYYDRIADQCLAILQPWGDVLDIGCGDGSMRQKLRLGDRYRGVDPTCPKVSGADLIAATHGMRYGVAEDLPFHDAMFDTALLYSVLQHVEDPGRALAEAHRVTRRDGTLALQVSVNDANPLFMWHWAPEDVLALVDRAGFVVEEQAVLEGRLHCVRAGKR